MKLLIIGANGKLGALLVEEALRRNHEVTAVVHHGIIANPAIKEVWQKSLFDLTREEVKGFDVILSAFGSGFEADPKINRQAINHLADIVAGTSTRIIMVGGAGTLYVDARHTQHVYQGKDHPTFLRGISENICLGLGDLKERSNVDYTLVCPSLFFDYEGKRIGYYQIGTEEEVVYNREGVSRISYRDFAQAMVDEAENGRYLRRCITICEV